MNTGSSILRLVARLRRVLWVLVGASLALYVGCTLWLAAVGLGYPFQLDYGEGIVLWFSQQLAHGHPIYKSLAAAPFASSNYPPVAMLLSAMLMPLLGDGYVSGRLLNFLAAILVSALIYRIASKEGQNQMAGILAAGLFLASPFIYRWIPLFRVDLIGVAFTFTGVFAAWKFERDGQKGWLAAALVACLLGFYTKQSLFAAPVAVCIALCFKNRRSAIGFASGFAVLAGAVYVVLDWMTAGGFTAGIIESNATVFLPGQLASLLANFALTFPILLALALWYLVTRKRERHVGVLEWYAVIASGVLVMAGRIGAWENYFIEVVAVGSLFAGLAIARLVTARPSPAWQVALPVLLLAQVALMWPDPAVAANLVARDRGPNEELRGLIQTVNGPIISEDMGALVTSGKSLDYYTYQYSMLAASGKWNQSWELAGLRTGLFPLVILEQGTREDVDHYRRFTRDFMSALDRYYDRTQTIGKYQVYTPSPLKHFRAADFGSVIDLVGWIVEPESLTAGTLHVEIAWQAKQAIRSRYTVFVHLVNARGDKVAQSDHEPLAGTYPTNRWGAGEVVRDTFTLPILPDWNAEQTWLWVGWYDSDSGERLAVTGGTDDALLLTTFGAGN